MGKGVFNFFESTVCDKDGNFSLKQVAGTLATAFGVTAACLMIPGASTAFTVFGVGMGLMHMITSGLDIANAQTDKEAEIAWQNNSKMSCAEETRICVYELISFLISISSGLPAFRFLFGSKSGIKKPAHCVKAE